MAVSPTLALSSTLDWYDVKIDVQAKDYRCIECKGKFSLVHHFKYVYCTVVFILSVNVSYVYLSIYLVYISLPNFLFFYLFFYLFILH